jgi:ABC-type uncharacterized transport system auxiliary subunit
MGETKLMKHSFKKLSRGFLVIGFVGVLTACAQAPVPDDHYYRLNLSKDSSSPGVKLEGIVEVERFVADGLLDSRPILFSSSANSTEVQSYHYHFWSLPPSIMLQNALTAQLQRSNAAKSIVTPNLRIEPDFVLSGKIFRFEQIRGQNNEIIVSLELGLKNTKIDKLIHLNTYTAEVSSNDASVSSAVTAFSTGIDKIINTFMADLRGKI